MPSLTAGMRGNGGTLLLFAPALLAVALARQRLLHTALLAGLQVERVPLHFFDNVLLLHFPLEAAQGVLKGFPLLKPYLSHAGNTPLLFWLASGAIIGISGPKSRKFYTKSALSYRKIDI